MLSQKIHSALRCVLTDIAGLSGQTGFSLFADNGQSTPMRSRVNTFENRKSLKKPDKA